MLRNVPQLTKVTASTMLFKWWEASQQWGNIRGQYAYNMYCFQVSLFGGRAIPRKAVSDLLSWSKTEYSGMTALLYFFACCISKQCRTDIDRLSVVVVGIAWHAKKSRNHTAHADRVWREMYDATSSTNGTLPLVAWYSLALPRVDMAIASGDGATTIDHTLPIIWRFLTQRMPHGILVPNEVGMFTLPMSSCAVALCGLFHLQLRHVMLPLASFANLLGLGVSCTNSAECILFGALPEIHCRCSVRLRGGQLILTYC